jgi:cyclopropane fatty-acyl-phospholipid synthase-like methyltransferase
MSITRRAAVFSTVFSALLCAQQGTPERHPDVPYVPTPIEVVEQMLRLADVHKGDVVYDLGCGEGRIVIMAAEKFNAIGTGVDIDPELIRDAREKAKKAGVSEQVKFIQGDLFETDIRPASVVTLYLLPSINEKLMPKLLSELKPGTRVVSFAFGIGDWKPNKTMDVNGRHIFLWLVPEGKRPPER